MIEKQNYSKNEKAEKIVGKRCNGIPSLEPFELGFACPICCKPINADNKIFDEKGELKEEYGRLQFSEYNFFMWCANCNIDIPSYLCLCANTKEAVAHYTNTYLLHLDEFKERIYKDLTDEQKDMQKARIEISDLKTEIHLLNWEKSFNDSFLLYFNRSLIHRIEIKLFTLFYNIKHRKEKKYERNYKK